MSTKSTTGHVKVSYRVFWDNGTSKYCTLSIAQYSGHSNKDIAKYLIDMFQREIGVEGLQKVKIISIDDETVNIIVH